MTELQLIAQAIDIAEYQDVVLQEEDNTESQDTGQQNADTVKGGDIYIQDIKGKLWKTCDWDDSVRPNAIAVFAKEAKFLIALTQFSSEKLISGSITDPFEIHMTAISNSIAAKADYEGAKNTANIIKLQPSKHHAVGYCNAFTFPDGKTKGFMPSLGQLWIAYQNKTAVEDALSACGGDAMYRYYWSSTFWGIDDGNARRCWNFNWDDGSVCCGRLWCGNYVRPFADFND